MENESWLNTNQAVNLKKTQFCRRIQTRWIFHSIHSFINQLLEDDKQ